VIEVEVHRSPTLEEEHREDWWVGQEVTCGECCSRFILESSDVNPPEDHPLGFIVRVDDSGIWWMCTSCRKLRRMNNPALMSMFSPIYFLYILGAGLAVFLFFLFLL